MYSDKLSSIAGFKPKRLVTSLDFFCTTPNCNLDLRSVWNCKFNQDKKGIQCPWCDPKPDPEDQTKWCGLCNDRLSDVLCVIRDAWCNIRVHIKMNHTLTHTFPNVSRIPHLSLVTFGGRAWNPPTHTHILLRSETKEKEHMSNCGCPHRLFEQYM